jgi:hypothetical protein
MCYTLYVSVVAYKSYCNCLKPAITAPENHVFTVVPNIRYRPLSLSAVIGSIFFPNIRFRPKQKNPFAVDRSDPHVSNVLPDPIYGVPERL